MGKVQLNSLQTQAESLPPCEERVIAFVCGRFPVPPRPPFPPSSVIRDGADVKLSFNIMPGRNVTETLHFKEYRVWSRYVEAEFDRSYQSDMEKSPSHLVFLTAEAHAQKLAYIAVAEMFERPYDPSDKEYFKIWWTCCFCNVPKMIRDEENLVQSLWIIELVRTGQKSYSLEAYSRVSGNMDLWAKAGVFLI
jgi:hypothetical protein